MSRIEQSAETENTLKRDLRKVSGELDTLKEENKDLVASKGDLEGIIEKHVGEKKQLSEIMKQQLDDINQLKQLNDSLQQQVLIRSTRRT